MENLSTAHSFSNTPAIATGVFLLELAAPPGEACRGVIRPLFSAQPEPFSDLGCAILKMDHMMDALAGPKPDMPHRRFGSVPFRGGEAPLAEPAPGGRASPGILGQTRKGSLVLCVEVLYRRHNSWQGEVTWVAAGQKKSFRSVLELMCLIESAVAAKK